MFGMCPREYLAAHDSDEISEHVVWLRKREWHTQWRIGGMIAAAVLNAGGGKKGGGWFNLEDPIPKSTTESQASIESKLRMQLGAPRSV